MVLQQLLVDLDVFELDALGNVRLNTRAQRKYFLWCSLITWESCFAQRLTYLGNGRRGSRRRTQRTNRYGFKY